MLGRSQLGEEVLPGVLTVLRPWRLAGTGPCTTQKSSGPGAASADIAGAAAGVQSYVFIVPLIGAHRAFRSQRPSGPAQAGHGHGHLHRCSLPCGQVTLEAGGADTYTQRAIPGPEPNQDSCTSARFGANTVRVRRPGAVRLISSVLPVGPLHQPRKSQRPAPDRPTGKIEAGDPAAATGRA